MGKYPWELIDHLTPAKDETLRIYLEEILDPRRKSPKSQRIQGELPAIFNNVLLCMEADPHTRPTMESLFRKLEAWPAWERISTLEMEADSSSAITEEAKKENKKEISWYIFITIIIF